MAALAGSSRSVTTSAKAAIAPGADRGEWWWLTGYGAVSFLYRLLVTAGIAHPLRELGIDANSHIACIQRMVIVKGVLKAKGVSDWQLPVFGKSL